LKESRYNDIILTSLRNIDFEVKNLLFCADYFMKKLADETRLASNIKYLVV